MLDVLDTFEKSELVLVQSIEPCKPFLEYLVVFLVDYCQNDA